MSRKNMVRIPEFEMAPGYYAFWNNLCNEFEKSERIKVSHQRDDHGKSEVGRRCSFFINKASIVAHAYCRSQNDKYTLFSVFIFDRSRLNRIR